MKTLIQKIHARFKKVSKLDAVKGKRYILEKDAKRIVKQEVNEFLTERNKQLESLLR